MLSMRDMETIVKALDAKMNLDGKLLTDLVFNYFMTKKTDMFFNQGNNKKIVEHKENKSDIKIEEFYSEFVKTVIQNDFIKMDDLQQMEAAFNIF